MRNFTYVLVFLLEIFITGCYSLYVDRSEKTITVNTTPEGAYVWDFSGTKLLGQTPLTFRMKADDYTRSRLLVTKQGYHDELVLVYDTFDGVGFAFLDSLLVAPFIVDLVTLSFNYGKYCGDNFQVSMTSASVPRPGDVIGNGNVYYNNAASAQAIIEATNMNLKNSNTPMINTPQPPPVRPMVNSAVKVQSSPKPTYTPKQIPQYQRIPRASSFGRSGNLPSTDWNTRQNTGLQRVR